MFLPILPGFPLLIAGAVVLSREWPPFLRALEKSQALFPFVPRLLEQMAGRHVGWRGRFSGEISNSITAAKTIELPTSLKLRLPTTVEPKQRLGCADEIGAGLKVLVFDQNLEDLNWHAAPFEARGFEVYKCTSIEAALRCTEREGLDFALVDQASTAFEGLRVIRHLVRYNLHTPFIVLAKQLDAPCSQQAFSLGALDYLQKPVAAREMNWIIDRYIMLSREQEGSRGATRR